MTTIPPNVPAQRDNADDRQPTDAELNLFLSGIFGSGKNSAMRAMRHGSIPSQRTAGGDQ